MSQNSGSHAERGGVFAGLDRSLLMLFLLNTGNALAMEAVNALFPLYVQSLGATVLEVGLLLSASGLVSTAVMLPSGWMSDRFGRKPTLVLSVALASFPPLLYTFVADWRQLIPWAVIYAVSFAIFIPARMVYIAESTDSGGRVRMYGYMNLAWPLGSLVGPAVAGALAEVGGFHYPFYFAAAVSSLTLLPAMLLAERRRPRTLDAHAEEPLRGRVGFSREVVYLLIVLAVYQLLVSAGIGTAYSLLSIFLTQVFAVEKLYVGLFFSLVGVSLFGSQLLGGWASSRFGLKKTMGVCLAFIPPLFVACAFAPNYEWFTVTFMALYGLYSMTWPASVAILMSLVDRSRWGLATGIRQTGVRLGFTVGPTLGGALWELYGPRAPFYASAALIALSIPFLNQLKEECSTA
ncbi:MAG: MFS transporter [Candidatus Bathyarchaeia archaeon]